MTPHTDTPWPLRCPSPGSLLFSVFLTSSSTFLPFQAWSALASSLLPAPGFLLPLTGPSWSPLLPLPSLCGFPGGSGGKESASHAGDTGSIPGSGRSPGGGMATHSSILFWRIPWTEEPGRLLSMRSHRV